MTDCAECFVDILHSSKTISINQEKVALTSVMFQSEGGRCVAEVLVLGPCCSIWAKKAALASS